MSKDVLKSLQGPQSMYKNVLDSQTGSARFEKSVEVLFSLGNNDLKLENVFETGTIITVSHCS